MRRIAEAQSEPRPLEAEKESTATDSLPQTPMKAVALSAFIGVYRRLIGFLLSF
jgi:hypothetical protein